MFKQSSKPGTAGSRGGGADWDSRYNEWVICGRRITSRRAVTETLIEINSTTAKAEAKADADQKFD